MIPWPKNLTFFSSNPDDDYLLINASNFRLLLNDKVSKCSIVQRAIDRYIGRKGLLFDDLKPNPSDDHTGQMKQIGSIDSVELRGLESNELSSFACDSIPNEQMIEDYFLDLSAKPNARLEAKTSWGLIRGLETLSQLIFEIDLKSSSFGIRAVIIDDGPRFKFRGYMLDTARHYISLNNIYTTLDAMAFNKLNVFHWHIVDDQSFPYVSSFHPELSQKSSFRPNMIYTQADIRAIINYAADRGIRVLPEFDSPGHTYSMRHLPDFLTECYNTETKEPSGDYGPVNPIKLDNYKIMAKFIKEFKQLFPDSYFHAGGDEVDYDCWKSNPEITQWLIDRNMTGNYKQLQNTYIRKIYDFLAYYNRTMLVWQEVFDDGAQLPQDAIIHIWKYRGERAAYMEELKRVVSAGYRAILSSCWYLNYIDYGQDWVKLYQCDPRVEQTKINGRNKLSPLVKQELVLGGEICMWSEFVDDTNVITRSWPRASAAAERLWSPGSKTNVNDFLHRLEQMRCRLLRRGVQAEPVNGPGYC